MSSQTQFMANWKSLFQKTGTIQDPSVVREFRRRDLKGKTITNKKTHILVSHLATVGRFYARKQFNRS